MAEDPDAVLAFLLGTMPSLDAASEANSSVPASSSARSFESDSDDDTPMLERLSDSEAASDWDAATSCESEGDSTQEQQTTSTAEAQQPEETEQGELGVKQEASKEDPGLLRNEELKDNNALEEHEDDCAELMNAGSGPELQQEEERGGEVEVKGVVKIVHERRASTKSKAVAEVETAMDLSTKTDLKRGEEPTVEEFVFVGCVATVLVAYLVACVYSFFHPLVVALPEYEELFSAYDMSNVSVHIVNPVDNALITPQGLTFEWTLANFPREALQLYGAEVFQYKVSLDDQVIKSEVGFLALGEGEEEEPKDSKTATLNRTVRVPIPLRKFTRDDDGELFKLHLDVTIPIPGLIGELKTYEQAVYVRKPPPASLEDGVQLVLTAPANGASFEQGQSIILEYTAVNVRKMEVLIDDKFFVTKTHVEDGNMLLRGLGVGQHKFEVKALDERSDMAASSVLHVDIMERFDPKTA